MHDQTKIDAVSHKIIKHGSCVNQNVMKIEARNNFLFRKNSNRKKVTIEADQVPLTFPVKRDKK